MQMEMQQLHIRRFLSKYKQTFYYLQVLIDWVRLIFIWRYCMYYQF